MQNSLQPLFQKLSSLSAPVSSSRRDWCRCCLGTKSGDDSTDLRLIKDVIEVVEDPPPELFNLHAIRIDPVGFWISAVRMGCLSVTCMGCHSCHGH